MKGIEVTENYLMEYSNRVQSLVQNLICSVCHLDEAPSYQIEKSMRLLRPASAEVFGQHTSAIKRRIKELILKHRDHMGDAPIQISLFEKEVDKLRRLNSQIIHPFLALLEPLSFHQISSPISASIQFTEHKTYDSAESGMTQERNDKITSENLLASPYRLSISEEESALLKSGTVWISKLTEFKILRDLLFIFQVIAPSRCLL